MTEAHHTGLILTVLPNLLTICQLDRDAELPPWALHSSFYTVSRTADELSVVCEESSVPSGIKKHGQWKAFKVMGPLDFSLTGVIASLSQPLADHRISIFTISTYDTDYILVETKFFVQAIDVLRGIATVKN